ncbi:alpha/beta fold hydrolase [Gordonia hydrophobica]|uniref:Alpha/beta fold hydrolase n=1 Tax=Gordonia hydrophobica TaxID=40516 RepID=A0ABZ2U6S2_9ACTN|nr:alpha/beta fold hydrolase [Gordonia hydrophobica]MBM7365366.1 pimeloyl-ACP methyl ester carboxylesterase [Gordonia hydrophobica]
MIQYTQTTVAADHVRLAVQLRGHGPTLLLLPGQANDHHWWDRTRNDFAASFTTVTFDYRGAGKSEESDRYSTRLFAEDALTVMDSLAIEHFHVYGASMGGRTAQWLAIIAPDRVRRLVLGCTTPGGEHAVERGDDVRLLLASHERDAALEDMMYTPEWRAAHPGPYQTLGDPTMSAKARHGHLAASNQHDAWDRLPEIVAPTLILHGTDDRFAPVVNAQLLADRIPGARVHTFDGARHGYFDECRDEASPMVVDFLSE